MGFVDAVILSIVEGITEFLPISSTGHLVLTANLLNIPQTEFTKSFEVIIQLGAILAVVFLYWQRLVNNTKLWPKIFTAFIPTALVGLIFYKLIKDVLLGNTLITLSALLIGGIILILFEKLFKTKKDPKSIEQLSYKDAVVIGLFQSISVIPGVSRAAATIIGGLFSGMNRIQAVEFSFILAIPTMAAATALDLYKSNWNFTSNELLLLAVGFIGAFITAVIAVKFFLKIVQKYSFVPFGIYRIVLSVVYFLVFFTR